MRSKKKNLWIAIAVIGIVIALIPKFIGSKPAEAVAAGTKGSAGKKGVKPVAVSVYIVSPQPITDKISSTGTVSADKDVQLRVEASGRVVSVNFNEGAAVTKGQLLLKLNDADLQASFSKSQATLSLAQERETRQKTLFEKEVGSKEEYQTAVRDLAAAQADAALAKAQLDKVSIFAPFDGVIGIRSVDEGGYITTGTVVANLVSRDPLKIKFTVPERLSGTVTRGSAVEFSVESSPEIYQATVWAVEPKVDEVNRTLRVVAICKNADRRVVPGSFAKVEMVVRQNDRAILVPSEALIPDAQGYKVFVKKDSVATLVPVVVGVRGQSTVEIVKGLTPGDTLIVSGLLSVRHGTVVEVKKAH